MWIYRRIAGGQDFCTCQPCSAYLLKGRPPRICPQRAADRQTELTRRVRERRFCFD